MLLCCLFSYLNAKIWEVTLSLPFTVPGVFDYKYLLKSGENNYAWEAGGNRCLQYDPSKFDTVLAEDFWRPQGTLHFNNPRDLLQGDPANLMLSNAFIDVVFRRKKSAPVTPVFKCAF